MFQIENFILYNCIPEKMSIVLLSVNIKLIRCSSNPLSHPHTLGSDAYLIDIFKINKIKICRIWF